MRDDTAGEFIRKTAAAAEGEGEEEQEVAECHKYLKKVVESFPRAEGAQAQGVSHVVADYAVDEARL